MFTLFFFLLHLVRIQVLLMSVWVFERVFLYTMSVCSPLLYTGLKLFVYYVYGIMEDGESKAAH